jgi:excisionase family DNA binding protein
MPGELLTISQAAQLLGVSVPTLRRWDAAGTLRPHRHPINGYRLYRKSEVLRLAKRRAATD